MFQFSRMRVLGATGLAGAAALAACAPKVVPPPPPPPPPPKVVSIPPRPVPPDGASADMPIPLRDAFGIRQTVNYRLTPAQTTWNLRSAFNVAALNCLEPQYQPIVIAYRSFLKTNAKKLTATTKAIDGEFRKAYGATFRVEQDAYMTRVYNYFALPPTIEHFCDASLVMSQESLAVVPAELDAFSARWMQQYESVFDQFFLSYEAWQIASAQWDAQYGAVYGTPQVQPASLDAAAPGPVLTLPQPVPPGTTTYGPATNRR